MSESQLKTYYVDCLPPPNREIPHTNQRNVCRKIKKIGTYSYCYAKQNYNLIFLISSKKNHKILIVLLCFYFRKRYRCYRSFMFLARDRHTKTMWKWKSTQIHQSGSMWIVWQWEWLQSFITNFHSNWSNCYINGHSIGNCKDFFVLILFFYFCFKKSAIKWKWIAFFLSVDEHYNLMFTCIWYFCFFLYQMTKLFFSSDWIWNWKWFEQEKKQWWMWFGFGSIVVIR